MLRFCRRTVDGGGPPARAAALLPPGRLRYAHRYHGGLWRPQRRSANRASTSPTSMMPSTSAQQGGHSRAAGNPRRRSTPSHDRLNALCSAMLTGTPRSRCCKKRLGCRRRRGCKVDILWLHGTPGNDQPVDMIVLLPRTQRTLSLMLKSRIDSNDNRPCFYQYNS